LAKHPLYLTRALLPDNFNAAYFPRNNDGGPDGFILRVEDMVDSAPPSGQHSGLAVVRRTGGANPQTYEHVDLSKVIIRSPGALRCLRHNLSASGKL